MADNHPASPPIQDQQTLTDNQPASPPIQDQQTLTDNQTAAEATQPTLGAKTIGTGLISKKQPWRDLVQQQMFAQPDFFKTTPSAETESTDKIRLLPELDSKSR